MGPRRPLAALALSFVGLAAAAPAGAAEPPRCDEEVWSRPGLERTLDIVCRSTDRVRIAEMPAHGAVAGESFDGWRFAFKLSSDETAPLTDRLVLDLDGPVGAARHTVTILNIPLDQNTPPRCDPVNTALRTNGAEPAVITLHAHCWDDERDDFTVHGSGPGTHLDAPLLVPGGRASLAVPFWRYRTAVSSGPEQAAYWAVDSQGARSADAPISLEVGHAVDRLPICRPNPAESMDDPFSFPVYMRPGATRRFAIICEDADGDPVQPAIASPPVAGTLTRFDAGQPLSGWWGVQRWVDVAYVPLSEREGDDRLGIVASGPRGAGPVADIRMSARSLPFNRGGGCGHSGGSTTPGTAVILEAWCSDHEGDPLTATITDPPRHGTADEPVVERGAFGSDRVAIRYAPGPAFEGVDLLTARVADGNGMSFDLEFSVRVATPAPPQPPTQYTPGPDADGWFWSPGGWARRQGSAGPSVGQAPAVAPLEQARIALRTRSVRLVRRLGTALVFAPRNPLKPGPRVRALAVTCAVRCSVDSAGALSGARSARRARARVAPGRARVLLLRLNASERRKLRRTRGGRAVFRVTARPATGGKRSGRIKLRLRG